MERIFEVERRQHRWKQISLLKVIPKTLFKDPVWSKEGVKLAAEPGMLDSHIHFPQVSCGSCQGELLSV